MYTSQAEISQSQKPTTALPVLENIPQELKEQPCWVAWEYRFRNGKWTKVPFGPKTGNFAKSNDPRTWATFEQAVEYYTNYSIHEGRGTVEGVGFMLADPYCGCDLDKCIHGADDVEPWARNYIDRLATYTEVSPSGTGAKLIFKARIPGKDHKKTGLGVDGKGAVELYDQRRFFTITGNRLPGTPTDVAQRQPELDAIYHELFPEKPTPEKAQPETTALVVKPGDMLTLNDADILAMASEAQGGDKFRSLYFHGDLTAYHGDHSRADQALCAMLAYWCGPDSEEQIDRLFRRSALYRDKWDRDDYRHRTIDKALDREPHEFHAVALVEFTRLEEQALQIVGTWQKEPEFAGLVERTVQRTNRKTTSGDTPVAPVSRGRRGFLIPELDSLPPAKWHVHRHFPVHGFVVLFGPSGNFKSFVAVDLALCIATGKPFLGTHAVKQGPVVYIVSEGAYGIKKRIKAWLQKHEQAAPANFLVIPARFNLQEQDEVVELLRIAEERLGCQPQAVFVDTLTRNFGPGDPNSLRDMQQFCSNLDIIRETTGGTVVVIHHTGWTETKP